MILSIEYDMLRLLYEIIVNVFKNTIRERNKCGHSLVNDHSHLSQYSSSLNHQQSYSQDTVKELACHK